VAGLSTRNYRRAVESVLEGYRIEKSSVSRQGNQLRVLCERRLEDLKLVVLMIDGIHLGGQVRVVALGDRGHCQFITGKVTIVARSLGNGFGGRCDSHRTWDLHGE